MLAVARLSFRESARNRVLHALLSAMVLICWVAHLFAWVSGDEPSRRLKVIGDLSLTSLSMLGVVASIFLGTSLVYQEVERRTIYTVLARPVSRGGFLLGKYLGLLGIVGLAMLAMGATVLISYALGVVFLPAPGIPVSSLPWGKLILAITFTYVELAVVIGVALLFSVAAHPIEGAVFAFVIVLAGHTTSSLRDLGAQLLRDAGPHPGLKARALADLLEALYVVLPNLEQFNLHAQAIHDLPISAAHLVLALLYALVWVAILLGISTAVLRRKVL